MDPSPASLALFEKMEKMMKTVYQILGKGYTESIYQKALAVELQMAGIRYDLEVTMPIPYKDQTVGFVRADILLRGDIPLVIETKATAATLKLEERWQVTKYMKLLGIPLGMLVNFPQSTSTTEPFIEWFILHENEAYQYCVVPSGPKELSKL